MHTQAAAASPPPIKNATPVSCEQANHNTNQISPALTTRFVLRLKLCLTTTVTTIMGTTSHLSL
jgi:hypothetical protein